MMQEHGIWSIIAILCSRDNSSQLKIEPATPRDIARTISRSAWGYDVVHEDTVDSYLKRLPEVEYVQWGKYLLKSKNI